MNLASLKKIRSSVVTAGLLASMISISACQQQPEPEASSENDINAEQPVPMSADPAEPNDIVVAADDAPESEVADDTIASVNTGVTQMVYLCSPELKVQATYKDEDSQVVIGTDMGTVTLTKTNEGSNPEVFEAKQAMDGGEGFTQWRVAHEARETGVIRTAGTDESKVDTYECKTNK